VPRTRPPYPPEFRAEAIRLRMRRRSLQSREPADVTAVHLHLLAGLGGLDVRELRLDQGLCARRGRRALRSAHALKRMCSFREAMAGASDFASSTVW
jgi:hypothetical protein